MKHDIDNPELPAEYGVTSTGSGEHTVALRSGPLMPHPVFTPQIRGATHVLKLGQRTTREAMVRELLAAARHLGWKGDIPERVTIQVDSGNAEFEPRQHRYKVRTGVWRDDTLALDVRP